MLKNDALPATYLETGRVLSMVRDRVAASNQRALRTAGQGEPRDAHVIGHRLVMGRRTACTVDSTVVGVCIIQHDVNM